MCAAVCPVSTNLSGIMSGTDLMVNIAGCLVLIYLCLQANVAGQEVTNKPVAPIQKEPVSDVTIELVGTINFQTARPTKSGI